MKTVEQRLDAIEGQWTNSNNSFKKWIAIWGHAILWYLTVLIPAFIVIAVVVAILDN